MLQSGNILGWLRVCTHLLQLTKDSKRHILSPPRLLTRAISTLGILLTLSYLTSAFDIWLHASSEAHIISTSKPQTLSNDTLFGKQINETRCSYYAELWADEPYNQLCGLMTNFTHRDVAAGVWPNDQMSISEAARTLTNTSESNMIAFTDQQEAILVPSYISTNMSFDATTVGVRTTCQS